MLALCDWKITVSLGLSAPPETHQTKDLVRFQQEERLILLWNLKTGRADFGAMGSTKNKMLIAQFTPVYYWYFQI